MKKRYVKLRPVQVVDRIFKYLSITLMVVYAISLLIPLIWMLYSSIKPADEFLLSPYALPKKLQFSNYAEVLSKLEYRRTKEGVGLVVYGLGDMFLYSIVWSVATPLIANFFNMLTSYVVCKYKFPGRNFIYSLGIFLMIIPIIGTGPASLRVHKALGLYDNFLGRILISGSGAFYGFNFILMYGAWKGIPWAYAEASFIDGSSNIRTFFHVMMPLMIPTFMVTFILGFLSTWNDYITFLTWLPSYPNLALGMYMFQYNIKLYGLGVPSILAGFTLTAIPTTVLYILSQKTIMTKMNVGGLKG